MEENKNQIDEQNAKSSVEAEVMPKVTADLLSRIRDILLLIDIKKTIKELRQYNFKQLEEINEWAFSVHLSASDNVIRKKKLIKPSYFSA